MLKEEIPRLAELNLAEKLLLLDELWDHIMVSGGIPLPDWHQAELERRYQEYLQDPTDGSPWPEVRERITRLLENEVARKQGS